MKQFDFLVLGSGIAGLSFALKVAPHGRVAIITKKDRAESNTNYAQGGIAAVTSKEDSFELHVRDTLEAGAGLCKENVVRTIISEGPARIAELIELGMHFSERESNGARELDLGKEGGHSRRRILHAKDVTGREIERALLAAIAERPNIEIFENHFVIDLITSQKLGYVGNHHCLGTYVLDKRTGELDLGKEGGHSRRRILHAKDVTGREIERALLAAIAERPNIEIFENHFVIDLITSQKLGYVGNHHCLGTYVLDKRTGEVETFAAPVTLLATGGCGKVYLYTTNPDIATGDGVAMAYRAGATVAISH